MLCFNKYWILYLFNNWLYQKLQTPYSFMREEQNNNNELFMSDKKNENFIRLSVSQFETDTCDRENVC
jgi:hypothetical protein